MKFHDFEIESIIFQKRKTISIKIVEKNKLLIKAPVGTTEEIIYKIIEKHQKNLQKISIKIEKRKKMISQIKYEIGETVPFFGEKYKLSFGENNLPYIEKDKLFISEKESEKIKTALIKWYKEKAKEYLIPRAEKIAKQYNFEFKKVKIGSARTRWGSCSSLKNINLTWRLMMLPEKIIDYVIIHELVHLKKPHHKKSFWKEIEKIMPDYKKAVKWLKENGTFFMEIFN